MPGSLMTPRGREKPQPMKGSGTTTTLWPIRASAPTVCGLIRRSTKVSRSASSTLGALIASWMLAQEVTRGMREAASRGFWMGSSVPYGYVRVLVQDGGKKRPKLELDPARSLVVRRIFDMVLQGRSILEVTKTLNAEGIPTTNGKKWIKTTIHTMLANEAYTGALVWGTNAKDGAPPVRVEDAFPAIVTKQEFRRAKKLLGSRAPKSVHPRRVASSYLLSGMVKCARCRRALTGHAAKSGR